MVLSDKQADFQLNLLSNADGVSYLMVVPFTEKQFLVAAPALSIDAVIATKTTVKAEITNKDEVSEETEDEDDTELDSSAFEDEDEDEYEDEDEEEITEEVAKSPLDFLDD